MSHSNWKHSEKQNVAESPKNCRKTSRRLHPHGLHALALLLSISWHIPPPLLPLALLFYFLPLVSRGLITGGRLRGWGGARRAGISVTLEEKPSDSGLNNDKSPWAQLYTYTSSSSSRLYKIWMDLQEEEVLLTPDLQISDHQAESFPNEVGRGARLKFSSLFSMNTGNFLIHEASWN